MRLLTFFCIGFLSIFLSSFDRAIQAQETNPVIASLKSLDELTLRGDHTENFIAALTRFSDAIDKASLDQLREAIRSFSVRWTVQIQESEATLLARW